MNTSTRTPFPWPAPGAPSDSIMIDVVDWYIENDLLASMTPSEITVELVSSVNLCIDHATANRRSQRQHHLHDIHPAMLARVLVALDHVVRVVHVDSDLEGRLAIYDESEGIYTTSKLLISRQAHSYCPGLASAQFSHMMRQLMHLAPRVMPSVDPDLVPVNNGFFDYSTKQLRPFTPHLIFLDKAITDFVADAKSPVLANNDGSTWEIENWMSGLSEDPAIVEALWQVAGAVVRPYVPWGKAMLLVGRPVDSGNEVFGSLLRALTGTVQQSVAKITTRKRLQDLTAGPIIHDENGRDLVITDHPALSHLIQNTPFSIQGSPDQGDYRHWGLIVQGVTTLLRFRSSSPDARQQWGVIEFNKTFSFASMNCAWAHVQRRDASEYVLKRVLVDMPNYNHLDLPVA